MTSCTTHLSILRARGEGLKLTGRIPIHNLLEYIVVHLWEVVTMNVFLKLRIGPRAEGDQEELLRVRDPLT